jgi:Tfp pilus assembly protein PilX
MANMRKVQNESGVALIIALSVLTILLLLAGVVLSSALNLSAASNRDTRSKRAFEAAQAGLQATLYGLNMNINSSPASVATLSKECVGGEKETVQSPTLPTGASKNTCPPYEASLGNGAAYRSWTTTVFEGVGTCAGVAVGTSKSVAERCITSEGRVTSGGTTVTQRVQERVASFDGKPVFGHAGVTAESGVVIANSAKVNGPIYTNGQLEIQNAQSKAEGYSLGPKKEAPLATKGASLSQLGTHFLPDLGTWEQSGRIPPVQPVSSGTGSSTLYSYPDGDEKISCAFVTCSTHTYPPDKFTKDNNKEPCIASACGWNAENRTLNLPPNYTWELSGETYNLCGLTLNGTARLAQGVKTVIYIDSPEDSSSHCPAGTGYFQINNGSFINNSPGLQCSPLPCTNLAHDTTALQINVFGPSNVANSTIYHDACEPTNLTCVKIGGTGEFWGTVFAPFSDVAVTNPGLTAGAIVGATVTFNNGGEFIQDRNVTSIVTTAALGTYYRTDWHQCQSTAPSGEPMSRC